MREIAPALVILVGCTDDPKGMGHVVVTTTSATDRSGTGLFAEFYDKYRPCRETQVFDDCTLVTTQDSCDGEEIRRRPIGVIAVTGGAFEASIEAPTNQHYASLNSPGLMFAGGELLTISATERAGTVFRETILAPGPVTITAPPPVPNVIDFGVDLELDSAAPLEVTWTGDSLGEVQMSVVQYQRTLGCRFPAGPGRGLVPRDALRTVRGERSIVLFGTITVNTFPLAVLDGDVTLATAFSANWPDGRSAAAQNAEIH